MKIKKRYEDGMILSSKNVSNLMLAQKISISLDPLTMSFIDAYLARHRDKNRSQVVGEALRLLQRQEQEARLETAYAASATSDRLIAAEFSGADGDGLDHEAW